MNENRLIKVLIVEDNAGDVRLIRELLSQAQGSRFHLEWTRSLSDGISCLSRENFDVVLLDLGLPESKGMDTFVSLKNRFTAVPVIILTGLADEELALKAMHLGAQDYLVKGQIDHHSLSRSILYAIERNRLEEALKAEHAFRESIEESITSGIVAVDLKGRQSYVNPAFCRMVGWSKEELLGAEPPFLYWPPEELEPIRRAFDSMKEDEQDGSRTIELRFRRNDGERFDALVFFSPLRSSRGEITGWVASVSDFTDHKRARESLRESEARLRQLSSELLTAQERERKRIAGDLHDSIVASLSAIKIVAESLQEEVKKTSLREEALNPLIEKIQKAIVETRRIMTDLRPAVLDDLGVISATRWFCREFQKTYASDLHIHLAAEERDVPENLKTPIFRIVQEALNNIAKHSRAGVIDVSLQRNEDDIELVIKDDGEGFNVRETLSKGGPYRGLGLVSMRERAELSGGFMTIESTRGAGTKIRAVWRLKPSADVLPPD